MSNEAWPEIEGKPFFFNVEIEALQGTELELRWMADLEKPIGVAFCLHRLSDDTFAYVPLFCQDASDATEGKNISARYIQELFNRRAERTSWCVSESDAWTILESHHKGCRKRYHPKLQERLDQELKSLRSA